jgi:hypothetical protein
MKRNELPYHLVILFKIQAAAEYTLSSFPIKTRKAGFSIQYRDKGKDKVVSVHAIRTYEGVEI